MFQGVSQGRSISLCVSDFPNLTNCQEFPGALSTIACGEPPHLEISCGLTSSEWVSPFYRTNEMTDLLSFVVHLLYPQKPSLGGQVLPCPLHGQDARLWPEKWW